MRRTALEENEIQQDVQPPAAGQPDCTTTPRVDDREVRPLLRAGQSQRRTSQRGGKRETRRRRRGFQPSAIDTSCVSVAAGVVQKKPQSVEKDFAKNLASVAKTERYDWTRRRSRNIFFFYTSHQREKLKYSGRRRADVVFRPSILL